ncbi:cation:proton antiporter [Bacterioplanoides sp.]|uniref:cation:proton antiporter n=1 Tax=Bacterioplanoides sp. TaxID=2066072 RepID=UPI003B00DF07
MEESILLLVAVALFFYGLLARRIEQADITAPMIFTLLGVICGPLGLSLISGSPDNSSIFFVAELTLALVLFTDASQVQLKHLGQFEYFPLRLLSIGLPLTIIAGAAFAYWLLPIGMVAALLLAIILTPTDAALAQSVMEQKSINHNLREAVNIESGLNDGIALPILLMALALHSLSGGDQLDGAYWGEFIATQLIAGTIIGVLVGRVGSYLINIACQRDWISPVYQRLSSISLAIIAFSLAEVFHGNGFIAVFLAGLFLKTQHEVVIERLKEFGEAEGELLTLAVFFIFGVIFVPMAWPYINWNTLVYALFSLTLARMLPVWLSLAGTRLNLKEKLFLAWFGPRGIASVLYLLLVMEEFGFDQNSETLQTIAATSVVAILLSIFLHGASTKFWIKAFQR